MIEFATHILVALWLLTWVAFIVGGFVGMAYIVITGDSTERKQRRDA